MERTNNYLSIAFEHGQKPEGASYGYIILPNASSSETAAYVASEHIEIIKQSDGIHAVKDYASAQVAMNFFKA